MNKEALQEQGIEYIINCSCEDVDNFFPDDFKYTELAVEDDHEADAAEHFEDVYTLLKSVKEEKSAALVHCTLCKAVAPTFVLAYMMMASARADKYLPLQKAHAFLKSKEPGCDPTRNDNLMTQLIELEKELYDEATMSVSRGGGGRGKGGRSG